MSKHTMKYFKRYISESITKPKFVTTSKTNVYVV